MHGSIHLFPLGLWQVLKGHQRADSLMEDLCDGKMYKDHPLFRDDPTALQIMLYYDDVEVVTRWDPEPKFTN